MAVILPFEESASERALIAPLVEATASGMERVNRLVVERTSSDVTLIPEVARYLPAAFDALPGWPSLALAASLRAFLNGCGRPQRPFLLACELARAVVRGRLCRRRASRASDRTTATARPDRPSQGGSGLGEIYP